MGRTLDEIFLNLFNNYQKTGRIGRVRPYNTEHARRIAYCAAKNIYKKEISTTSSQPCQPTGGVTGSQTCCQLKLF